MNKKKKFLSYSLWWLDLQMLNITNLTFKYSYINNVWILNLSSQYYYYFFLLTQKNLNCLNFYVLDTLVYKHVNLYNYYVAYQSIFFDFQVIVETKFQKYIDSISKIYPGSLWIERESKEFNSIQYKNLIDTRKLLLNYNYNADVQYNNVSNIINDLKI